MAVESCLVKSFSVLYTFAINTNGFFSSVTINSPVSLAIFQLIVSPFFHVLSILSISEKDRSEYYLQIQKSTIELHVEITY